MTLFTSLLTNPVALTIAELVAKAALIVGIAAAVTYLLRWRRASAATQHLVWAASVVALIALPVLTLAAPAWIVEVAQSPVAAPITADMGASIDSPEGFVGAPEGAEPSAVQNAIAPVPERRAPMLPPLSLMQVLAGVYLIGVIGLLLRLALGSWSVARLARSTAPVVDASWVALLRDLSCTLGIDRPVRLLQSDDATVPMTWGTRRPHVLLPTEANEWPAERRRAVLTHELAHVVRFDCLTQWLASLACALYWMHPAVWYAARRLRVERERACDDYVIESGMQPREYASELFEVAQKYRGPGITAAAALGMARPSELEGRMLSLMDGFRSHNSASRNWIAAVTIGMAAILIPLGCMQPGIARAKEMAPAVLASESLTVEDDSDADSYDSTFTRTVPAQDGGTLVLDLPTGGNITIRSHDRNTVDLRASLGGRNWRDTEVTVSPAGSTVRVESRPTTNARNFSTSHAFEIRVPRRQNVRIRSGGGAIDIRGVDGTFTGNTGGGEIVLSQLRGSANLATGGGAITVTDSRLDGEVRTGGGAVQFRNVSGGLRGDGNTGNFDWEGGATIDGPVGAPLRYRSAGGDVDIESAPAGADVQTGGGDIRIGRAASFVNARTGGGSITIRSMDGRVHASTGAGAVNVTMVGDPRRGARDVEIHAGVGTVTLSLPAGIEAEFDIETGYTNNFGRRVRIDSDFPLQYTESSDWVTNRGTPRKLLRGTGRTGAGTHKIKVRSVNGDVIIRRGSGQRTSASGSSRSAGGQPGDMDCVGDCTLTLHTGTERASGPVVNAGGGDGRGDGFAFVTGTDTESRRGAVRAMARNAPEAAAIAGLERLAFEDSDPEVQREATRELAKFRDDYAIRPLLRIALEHPGEEARREAATSLGVLATDDAIRALQNMAVADRDRGVQRDAVRALAATHDRTDVRRRTTSAQIRTILEHIAQSHGEAAIRTLAAQSIAKLGRASGEL